MNASVLMHKSPSESILETVSLHGANTSGRIIVKALFSGISLGTERIVSSFKVPFSMRQNMKVPYQIGNFNEPVGYGYAMVGEVIGGEEAWIGKKVHLMHPHQNLMEVNVDDVMEIPDLLDAKRATLISNMETAINGFWDGELSDNQDVLVVGFGQIGALLAAVIYLSTHRKPCIAEVNPKRINVAKSMGFEVVHLENLNKRYPVIYHTTSKGHVLNQLLEKVLPEGQLIEMSWYGEDAVELNLGAHFHRNRLRLISSQVSEIPRKVSNKWDYTRRKKTCD
jgi:2-desacetyl-2-hydroxyethyl bacteriochlorophyllide A dehydrogenase